MSESQEDSTTSHSDHNGVRNASDVLLPRTYRRACRLAVRGRYDDARKLYEKLECTSHSATVQALVANDLGSLAALSRDYETAQRAWQQALQTDPNCSIAQRNLDVLKAEGLGLETETDFFDQATGTGFSTAVSKDSAILNRHGARIKSESRLKIAILSFLFNWPSTGGGIVHTVELGRFLDDAGYEARIFHVRFPAWRLGRVDAPLPVASEALEFSESDWNVPEIQRRFRQAVDAFGPDHVLITDSWNMKPHLAEAVRGYPYLLRFQALECLCPLNNLRLLATGPDDITQCPRNQLASPESCRRCVQERRQHSGPLHQLERELAGVGTPEYDRLLRQAVEQAETVLVLNPLTEAMLQPFAREVRVVPWGMDPARFPWQESNWSSTRDHSVTTLFMAAVAGEFIKGFHILHDACRRLWQSRRDFELVVTFDPPGPIDEFTRSVGWASQEELPVHYRQADICIVPTIAQEGLSRTSVEAMASGLPVIASRIGGLPSTVADGATGLLFEPGNAEDLARKIAILLDDPQLRRRMGLAGRRRFEEDFTWPVVIERFYRPLLERRKLAQRS